MLSCPVALDQHACKFLTSLWERSCQILWMWKANMCLSRFVHCTVWDLILDYRMIFVYVILIIGYITFNYLHISYLAELNLIFSTFSMLPWKSKTIGL